ncbi:hypothetical protein EII31_04625 [Leucobacter sp. OH2974_COT-288]|nr:hypothetical protein EII31_04625 [Leucobacter sp. OH2974_COT-288]
MTGSKPLRHRPLLWVVLALLTLALGGGALTVWQLRLNTVIDANAATHTLGEVAVVQLPVQWRLRHSKERTAEIVSPENGVWITLTAYPAGTAPEVLPELPFLETLGSGNSVLHTQQADAITAQVSDGSGASVLLTARTADGGEIKPYRYEIAAVLESIKFLK